MAKTIFYPNATSLNLARDIVSNDPDLYIEKYHYVGTGVYALTTAGTSTLTPVISPVWGVDDFLSTVNSNLVIVDDNGVPCAAKIDSNAADALTFDETACLIETDESTPGTFTAAKSYDFYVLTPANNEYGWYLGRPKGAELTPTPEYNKYITGEPSGLANKFLKSLMLELTFPHIQKSNKDFMELFGLQEYGDQTSQVQYGVGPEEVENCFYRVHFVGPDVYNRNYIVKLRKIQFDLVGNFFNRGDSGAQEAVPHADVLADQFYPRKAQHFALKRLDAA